MRTRLSEMGWSMMAAMYLSGGDAVELADRLSQAAPGHRKPVCPGLALASGGLRGLQRFVGRA